MSLELEGNTTRIFVALILSTHFFQRTYFVFGAAADGWHLFPAQSLFTAAVPIVCKSGHNNNGSLFLIDVPAYITNDYRDVLNLR